MVTIDGFPSFDGTEYALSLSLRVHPVAPFACKVVQGELVRMIRIIKWNGVDIGIGDVEKGWRKVKYSTCPVASDKISLSEWKRFFDLWGLDVTL